MVVKAMPARASAARSKRVDRSAHVRAVALQAVGLPRQVERRDERERRSATGAASALAYRPVSPKTSRCRRRSSARVVSATTISARAAAASMRALCAAAMRCLLVGVAACAPRRRRSRAAPRRRRRRSGRRAASAAPSSPASVVLPVLSAPSSGDDEGGSVHDRATGLRREPLPGAPADERHDDEDRIEHDRQPQALVGEEGAARRR